MTIQPCWQKPQINLIFIGETGSGKTALLNLLANTCAGIELDNFKACHDVKNEQAGSQIGSQTNEPKFHTIHCANGNEINILDTPGLSDTRGIDMDKQHKAAIDNAIKEHFETIDAVIVLVNGTVPRVNESTQYALTTIAGMFPHSIADNITFICTMVSNPADLNFDQSCLPVELKKAKIWSINNPFAQRDKFQKRLKENPQIFDDETLEEISDVVRQSYTKTLKTLAKVFQFLDQCQIQPTKTIHELYMMALDMEAGIFNVIVCIDQLGMKQKELRKLQKDADYKQSWWNICANYKEIGNTSFYELESHDQFNTICLIPGCYRNCHTGCGVQASGFPLYRTTCSMFSKNYNRICKECGHSAEGHRKYRHLWVKKTKSEDAKGSDDEEIENFGEMIGRLQKACKGLEQEIHDREQELSERCEKYNQLALSGSFIKYISSTISLLERRYESMSESGADDDMLQGMREAIKQFKDKKKVLRDTEDQRRRTNGQVQQNFSIDQRGGLREDQRA
ncbi:hypothetical protein C8R42DRAFT_747832 [Lentinula raphanica]|nr:hypothetical protein C8R42DRAFT_747832 [Lentinula raphanica]